MNKKWLLALVLAAFVGLLAACGDNSESSDDKDKEKQSSEQAEAPEPDLKNIPDVVAEVNGEKIEKKEFENTYKSQFQMAAMQAQMSGQELDQDQLKKSLAESMVGQELLIQEADNRELTASEEEINKRIDEIVEQQPQVKDKEDFMKQLKDNGGMDEKEVMSQLETQVKVDKLIAEEAGDTEPSEEEVKKAYDDMKKSQEDAETKQEVPAYEDVKPQIQQSLKQQKESEATQKIVDDLREKAEVKVNI
ncbi:UNVERIFIED_CONTAM: SurA N-terminal domain-containing protein [Halobacillus marinus]|uniref:SurA N-terminal domain-containing protein n=1 Tax=Halobacillus sp. BAB-2008 TaxID=1246484 RepID=UPI0002E61EC9|nr:MULTISPECIES: SurA N-terminal domain-containing protein [unclassified Halobacillus]